MLALRGAWSRARAMIAPLSGDIARLAIRLGRDLSGFYFPCQLQGIMKTEGKKQSQEAEKDENSPPSPMRFDKLLVSISGGTKRRKEELAGLIKAKGGRYTGEMSKGCTHLVVLDKPSDTRKASAKET